MGLRAYIEQRRAEKDLLLMAHVVCGYPSFEDNLRELEIMAEAGVDLVELQFPFSEPNADGPLFVRANEISLRQGTTTAQCFEFMAEASARFPFRLLMMGYYNTVFSMGEETFLRRLREAGGSGYILPDLPVEEAGNLHRLSDELGLEPILLMTPTSSETRLARLGQSARGFVYVVARKGVTGSKTEMGGEIAELVARCRRHTDLPLGVGFGISSGSDMDFLRGVADIAIVGTAALRSWEEGGATALRDFFGGLTGKRGG